MTFPYISTLFLNQLMGYVRWECSAVEEGNASLAWHAASAAWEQRAFANSSDGFVDGFLPITQWIGLRENLQETMVFTIKMWGFPVNFP